MPWKTVSSSQRAIAPAKTEKWIAGKAPPLEGSEDPSGKAEGYLLQVEAAAGSQPVVWIVGADPRGTLYGVGALLRNLIWGKNRAELPSDLELRTAPAYPIRADKCLLY